MLGSFHGIIQTGRGCVLLMQYARNACLDSYVLNKWFATCKYFSCTILCVCNFLISNPLAWTFFMKRKLHSQVKEDIPRTRIGFYHSAMTFTFAFHLVTTRLLLKNLFIWSMSHIRLSWEYTSICLKGIFL